MPTTLDHDLHDDDGQPIGRTEIAAPGFAEMAQAAKASYEQTGSIRDALAAHAEALPAYWPSTPSAVAVDADGSPVSRYGVSTP